MYVYIYKYIYIYIRTRQKYSLMKPMLLCYGNIYNTTSLFSSTLALTLPAGIGNIPAYTGSLSTLPKKKGPAPPPPAVSHCRNTSDPYLGMVSHSHTRTPSDPPPLPVKMSHHCRPSMPGELSHMTLSCDSESALRDNQKI